MSKKSQKTKANTKKVKQKKAIVQKTSITPIWVGIALITFAVFVPSINNDFLNWDDPSYVLQNQLIQNLSLGGILTMFSPNHFLMSNYHPLTELSLAIDYQLFGLNPKGFHFMNLLFHVINTVLVFLFVHRLFNKKIIIASVAALFFGIHPMHVESVCWISERKDVLHVLFYVWGLIQYLKYLDSGRAKKHLIYTGLLFLCALLSKAQAVTFPLIIILIDYLKDEGQIKAHLMEKIPFFVLSIAFGLLAIKAQSSSGATTMIDVPMYQSLFVGNFGIFLYLVALFFPVYLSALHPYPFEVGAALPVYFYAAPLVGLALLFFIYKMHKKGRFDLVFGMVFFLFAIGPMLQFLPVGEAIIAERYTYLPYVGLFIIAGTFFDQSTKGKFWSSNKPIVPIVFAAFTLFFLFFSFQRTKDWKSGQSLWSDAMEKYPDRGQLAYVNLSHFYLEVGAFDLAINSADKGLEKFPNHYRLWVNKAFAFMKKDQHAAALPFLAEAANRDPGYFEIYINQAMCYDNLKQYDNAIAAYTKTIEVNDNYAPAYLYRGVIHINHTKNYDLAISDFQNATRINPNNQEAWTNLAVAQFSKGEGQNALQSVNQSISIQEAGRPYYIRALVYESLGQYANAYQDGLKAQQLGDGSAAGKLQEWKSKGGM